ncbi:MAG: glutamate 5-kinase, partial [Pseudomonadota bacterium]
MSKSIAGVKRIVVKVGSTLVTNNGAGLDRAAIAMWAEQVSILLKQGCQVLMVSSG